jgi:hypothetical protein
MTTTRRTSTPQKAEITHQPPTHLGVILREGIVTALAGVFKVGAEVGRVAARATSDALDAAARVTADAGQAAAKIVKPEVPPGNIATPTETKPETMTARRAKTKRQAKAVRKPPGRSGPRRKVPDRRRKTG